MKLSPKNLRRLADHIEKQSELFGEVNPPAYLLYGWIVDFIATKQEGEVVSLRCSSYSRKKE